MRHLTPENDTGHSSQTPQRIETVRAELAKPGADLADLEARFDWEDFMTRELAKQHKKAERVMH